MPEQMTVGLIGCGNIGTDLCLALSRADIPARIAALTDIVETRAQTLLETHQLNATVCGLEENVASVDFVVECAAADAVKDVVTLAIEHRTPCLVVSVGGLLAHPELLEAARAQSVPVSLPSGALCGLDGIRAAKEAGLDTVTLTTRKPPEGLVGAPYLIERGIDLKGLAEAQVVFEGSARQAVEGFPKNVNVAAALSLMGIGPEKTRVRIIADPDATTNSHEVAADGAFGRLTAITENRPSPRNPKSSYLASLSACAALRAAADAFVSNE